MRNDLIRHALAATLFFGSLVAQASELDSGGSTLLIRNQGVTRYLGRALDGDESPQGVKYRPSVLGVPSNITSLSAGDQHALFLLPTGAILGSGLNHRGQLGTGAVSVTPDLYQDVTPAAFTLPAVGVEAGRGVSYCWTATGLVFGWGANFAGQIGIAPSIADVLQPTIVPIPADVIDVQSARLHTIALDSFGQVWEWGSLPWLPGAVTPPTLVAGLNNIQAIATSQSHAVALATSGAVFTWGLGAPFVATNPPLGVAGNPTLTQIAGMPSISAIAAGLDFTISLDNQGRVWTAGNSPLGFGFMEASGLLGPRSFEARRIPNLFNVASVAAAGSRDLATVGGDIAAFAQDVSGTLWVWGGRERATGLGLGNPGITQVDPTVVPMTGAIPGVIAGFSNCLNQGGDFLNFGLGYLGGEITLNQTIGPNCFLFASPGPATLNLTTLSPFCHIMLDFQGLMSWIAAGVVPIPSLPTNANAMPQRGTWIIDIPNDPVLSGYEFTIQSAAISSATPTGLALSTTLTYTLR